MPKVLIVDDDPDIVDSLKLVLAAEGYAVAAATSREEAMRGVEQEKPDLIILDVMMEQPDDGFAMAQELRRLGHRLPILMLTSVGRVTGMTFDKDDELVPVDAFCEKPIRPETLLGHVDALLRN
jgi:DNA-binding response OmpR family regulator